MKFTDGQVFTTESISPRMEKTPEGFLLCRDVPISRTGVFGYSELESGIKGVGGIVKMTRSAEELFKPDVIRSFEGKPVVIGHSSFVDPSNWKERSIGLVQNVRPGEGEQSSMLMADLLLTDAKGIQLVESGRLREVSCGYDAEPVEDGIGQGHQVGIVGNHVALVPKGRCGDACKIRDSVMTTNFKTLLRRWFKDSDEEKFNETLDQVKIEPIGDEGGEGGEGGTDPIQPKADDTKTPEERIAVLEHEYGEMGQKIDAMRQMLEQLMPKPTGDEEPKPEPQPDPNPDEELADDGEAKKVLDEAEELCPGMKRPTGDAEGGKFTVGLLSRVKRQALKGADVKEFGDAATLEGSALDTAFKAALMLKRSAANPKPKKFGDGAKSGRPTNAELNKLFENYWHKEA